MVDPRKIYALLLAIITFCLTSSSLESSPRQIIIIQLPPPQIIIQQMPMSAPMPSLLVEQVNQMDRLLAEMQKQIDQLERQMRDLIALIIEHDKVLRRHAEQLGNRK